MSTARVGVLEVVGGNLTVKAAARAYGPSRQHVHRLLKRFREGGLDAVDTRSRRPSAVSDDIITAIVLPRGKLTSEGLDAGPVTLQSHLAQQGLPVPSTTRRVLHQHGLIAPQPRKRPKNSDTRVAAEQLNQCWQSDFTHWTLADGTDVEILNWLDGHSRYLLTCTAHRRVTGPDVVTSFTDTAQRNGLHIPIHPGPQRLRTTTRRPGHHPEERSSRTPSNSPCATAAACTTSASAGSTPPQQ